MKILLTGATGFLGSHIAEELIEKGYDLLLTKRFNSNLWRCDTYKEKVVWINTDISSWVNEAKEFKPDIIINSAWNGVSAANREDWNVQVDNLIFQQKLLELAKIVKVKKFIGIGSQAEYGEFNECIDETYPTKPTTAYGTVKLASSIIMSSFCEQHEIQWYWFRLFSCFGERESDNWLIPSTIKNMISKNSMDLTNGEQLYSYLYIKDVAKVFVSAVKSNASDGIYHIASEKSRSLKEILILIKENLNTDFKLNFGALPYRKNQSMINSSFMEKTKQAFGNIDTNDFNEKLIQTIAYYKETYK